MIIFDYKTQDFVNETRMGLETDTVTLCYRSGFLGWLLLTFARFSAITAWAGFTWFSLHSKELLFILLSQSYWFSVALQYAVSSYILKWKPDDTSCNNDPLGSPPLLVWLLYHYMAIAVTFELLEKMPGGFYGWIQRLIFALGIPAIWIYSGNATLVQSVYAALLGTFVGMFVTLDAYVFWDPHRRVIAKWAPMRWMGVVYHENIHDSYTVSSSSAERRVFF